MQQQYRQGDVFITRVADEIPKDVKPMPREKGRIILAHGEVTGHAHAIKQRGAKLVSGPAGRFLCVTSAVDLTHEEHGTITLPPGNYRVGIQREYSPEAIRDVKD